MFPFIKLVRLLDAYIHHSRYLTGSLRNPVLLKFPPLSAPYYNPPLQPQHFSEMLYLKF